MKQFDIKPTEELYQEFLKNSPYRISKAAFTRNFLKHCPDYEVRIMRINGRVVRCYVRKDYKINSCYDVTRYIS